MTNNVSPKWSTWGKNAHYEGRIWAAAQYWLVFDCAHFVQRVGERVIVKSTQNNREAEQLARAMAIFQNDIANAFDSEEILETILSCSKGCKDRRVELSRFQLCDRINGLTFVFQVAKNFREIFLITIIADTDRNQVSLKPGRFNIELRTLVAGKAHLSTIQLLDGRSGKFFAVADIQVETCELRERDW